MIESSHMHSPILSPQSYSISHNLIACSFTKDMLYAMMQSVWIDSRGVVSKNTYHPISLLLLIIFSWHTSKGPQGYAGPKKGGNILECATEINFFQSTAIIPDRMAVSPLPILPTIFPELTATLQQGIQELLSYVCMAPPAVFSRAPKHMTTWATLMLPERDLWQSLIQLTAINLRKDCISCLLLT